MPQQQVVSVSGALANLVATSSWRDVSGESHEAKRSILNFFATALGSSNDVAVTSALQVLTPFSGNRTSSIIGRSERLDALGAAFVNAISANLLDYDDTHLDTIIHPSAPVAAPVLALAQARNLSGRDVLTAFILGVEVECRIGNAVSPGHYARGWHITSTCGIFGAAAACAKLLGLSEDGIANSIGIAASQSAGIVENLSSAAKNVSVGNAARNGLFSALLSEGGYAASTRAIEGPLGWARAMGDQPDLDALTGGLGDARGDRLVITERDARVSIHHSVACVLQRGAAGVLEFSEPVVFQPEIARLREKVTAELDTSLPDGAARVSIRTRSGKILSEEVMSARGSLAAPLSDADIEAKLHECARSGEARCDPERLIEAVWRLETLPDIAPLVNSSSGRPQ